MFFAFRFKWFPTRALFSFARFQQTLDKLLTFAAGSNHMPDCFCSEDVGLAFTYMKKHNKTLVMN